MNLEIYNKLNELSNLLSSAFFFPQSLSWFVKTHPPGGSVQFACTVLTCSIVSVKPMVAVPKQSGQYVYLCRERIWELKQIYLVVHLLIPYVFFLLKA